MSHSPRVFLSTPHAKPSNVSAGSPWLAWYETSALNKSYAAEKHAGSTTPVHNNHRFLRGRRGRMTFHGQKPLFDDIEYRNLAASLLNTTTEAEVVWTAALKHFLVVGLEELLFVCHQTAPTGLLGVACSTPQNRHRFEKFHNSGTSLCRHNVQQTTRSAAPF